MTIHYPAPTFRILTDDERNVQAELAADQYYYCEDCLCSHMHHEYMTDAEQANDPDGECYEHYLRIADAEFRAEADYEERRWA